MPRFINIFAVAVFSTFLFTASAEAAPSIGAPAPDFTAIDSLSGKQVALHDLKGKLVVLEWNNFECPFIKKFYSVGAMQALQKNTREGGVIWISINSSGVGKEGYIPTVAEAKTAIGAHHANPSYFLLDHDGKLGHLYDAKATPTMFVIDKEGVLAYGGAIDNKPSADPSDIAGAHNYVSAALAALEDGKPVKVTSTKAYGCFVHYE